MQAPKIVPVVGAVPELVQLTQPRIEQARNQPFALAVFRDVDSPNWPASADQAGPP